MEFREFLKLKECIERGTMPKWISVKDKLPPCGELVLASAMSARTNKHGWFCLAQYTDHFEGVHLDEMHWLWSGMQGRITHWMPLPDPPND